MDWIQEKRFQTKNPIAVSSARWKTVNSEGRTVATASLIPSGKWIGIIEPWVGAESVEFLTFIADSPTEAFAGVMRENIKLITCIMNDLETISSCTDPTIVEDVLASV